MSDAAPEIKEKLIFEDEPAIWMMPQLDLLLDWIAANKFSDISILPNAPIFGKRFRIWSPVTERKVSSDEIFLLADSITRSSAAAARVRGGDAIDASYEAVTQAGTRIRFRVNITGCRDGYSTGANIVMRTIPSIPPTMDQLNVEPDLRKAFFPDNGLIMVSGVMGTGKSTLIASGIREVIETGGRSVSTYEAPIEFDFTALPIINGPVTQSEIPIHLEDGFAGAARNAARRATDVILLGEARDIPTMRSMIELAELGPAVYATLHTNAIYDIPSRILNMFPTEERPAIAAAMFTSLRLLVQQRLLENNQGTVTAVKEYLVITQADRDDLMNLKASEVQDFLRRKAIERKTDLLSRTRELHAEGIITDFAMMKIARERDPMYTNQDDQDELEEREAA